jgi:hypothetical protein
MTVRTKNLIALLFAPVLLGFTLTAALAGRCGDDVDGERVACACGDVVVSDTRLLASDPVVRERCAADGLAIRAPQGAESITLDLGGLTLAGRGAGTGVLVLDGGREGAVVVGGRDGSPGHVAGFRVGVAARGSRKLKAAENLIVVGNDSDGLRISGRGAAVRGVVADDNGDRGVRVRGRDHALDGVSARGNKHFDLRVSGNGHYVGADARTIEGRASRVTGAGNAVSAEIAR